MHVGDVQFPVLNIHVTTTSHPPSLAAPGPHAGDISTGGVCIMRVELS